MKKIHRVSHGRLPAQYGLSPLKHWSAKRNDHVGITNSNKEPSTARIDCGSSFQVRLSLTAEPDIVTNPTDIVLILDRSKRIAGSAL